MQSAQTEYGTALYALSHCSALLVTAACNPFLFPAACDFLFSKLLKTEREKLGIGYAE
jgi:hypothetical protein